MRIASILLPLLSLLFRDCTGSTFYQPPGSGPAGDFQDNPQYAVGDVIDLQWELTDPLNGYLLDLFIIQTSPELETRATLFRHENSPQGWEWRVSLDGFSSEYDPDLSNVYYLRLEPSSRADVSVTCHYFNITRSDESPVSPPVPSPVSSSVLSSTPPSFSTSSPSIASPTTTPSATSTPELSRDELSTGAVAGIAVGATFVGTLFIVGLAGFLFWRRWGNNKKRGGEELGAITTANDGNEIHVYKRDVSEPSSELYVESTRRFGAEGSKPIEMRFEMSGDSVVRK
ncbi:hypothetical protein CSIM01_08807 [Colletotrichum simmondsii]|uniref:Uncharacterized protein n=1 Tax=Colletotrichum simmondsii TaxID=703756 RepID=A0A135T8M6_9PEZI|nr:hypothetical protein CSIM01_08807 [Colletotrichum simmondsii]